jgi:hypothetical protein
MLVCLPCIGFRCAMRCWNVYGEFRFVTKGGIRARHHQTMNTTSTPYDQELDTLKASLAKMTDERDAAVTVMRNDLRALLTSLI